jgi:hypothetical protein
VRRGAFDDSKLSLAARAQLRARQVVNRCQGGRELGQLSAKAVQPGRLSFDLDSNGAGFVANRACQAQPLR